MWESLLRKMHVAPRLKEGESVLFVPTPWAVARQMLEVAETCPGDVVYDLGSGDGRIPIMAAQEFGARAVGIELNAKLCAESTRNAAELGLEETVRFRKENFFAADLREATVVTLYLLSIVNGQLQQRLASHLRAGARVVAVDFEVPGWNAERTFVVKSEGDVEYTLFLYRRQSSGALAGDTCPAENYHQQAHNRYMQLSLDTNERVLRERP